MRTKRNQRREYSGKLPINCRIDIDYNKEKPKVKFGYPYKKQQKGLANSGPHTIIFFIIYFFLTCLVIGMLIRAYDEKLPPANNCTFKLNYTEKYVGLVDGSVKYNETWTNWTTNQRFMNMSLSSTGIYNRTVSGVTITCDNNQSQYFQYYNYRISNGFFNLPMKILAKSYFDIGFVRRDTDTSSFLLIMVAFSAYALVIVWYIAFLKINRLIAKILLKFKWYQKIVPEYNSKISGRAYYKIIKEVPANKIIEVPLFHNVALDYNAKGTFSKHLKHVEIREHPFNKGLFRKGKLKKKKGNNYMLWYAKFYFDKVPKKGKDNYLEIMFK